MNNMESQNTRKTSYSQESSGKDGSSENAQGGFRKRERRARPPRKSEKEIALQNFRRWVPKTQLSRRVKQEEITEIFEVFDQNEPIKEEEVVTFLLPRAKTEILSVDRIVRMKSSGGRRRLLLTLLLGAPGYMGIGIAKGESMFDTMNLVQRRARLNLFPVKRGCGAWSCGCGNTEHTIPYKVRGRAGSVTIDLIPAPRGSGLAIGPVGQKILSLVGIKDIASKSSGHTRTTKNYALAVAAALKKLRELCLSRVDRACIQNIQRQAEEDLTDDAEKLLNEQRTVEMPEESHDE